MSSSSDVDSAANASPLPTTTSASKGNGEGSIGANARRRRRNGFACTPHPGQVAAWLVLVLFSLWFFGVVVTATFHSPSPVSTAAYCAGGLLLGLHLFFHIFTTAVNPADERLLQQWDALGEPVTFDRRQHSHVIEQLYCNICQVHVDAQSKHCRVCNKCVAGIDHHCRWLNTCVGRRNYYLFFMTVLSAFLTSVVFLGFGVYATVRHFSVGAVSYTRVFGNASLTLNGTVFVVLNIIFVALLAVIALFIGELLLYHCWLAWQGISTFQHYLEKRARIEGTEPPARPTRRRDQRVLTTLVRPNQAVLDTPDEKKKSANKRKGRRWLGRRDNRIQPIANVAGDGVSTDPAPDPSPNPAAAVSWNAASPSMRQNGGAMAWTATSDPRTEGNSRAAAVETPRQRDEDGFVESDHDDTLEVNAPQDLDRTRSISPALSRATLRALPAPPSLVSTTDGAPPSLALLPLPSPTVAPPTASSITRTAPTSPQTAPPCDTPNLTFPRTPSKVPTDEANEASRRTSQSVRERRRKTRTRTDQATRRRRSVDDSDIDPLAMTGAHGSATLAELAAYAKRLRDETMNAIESKGPGKEKSDDNEAPIPRKIWPDSLSGGERTVSAKTLPRLEMENEGHVDSEPSLAALVQAAHATDPIGDLSNSPRRTSALLANARRESAPRVVVHSVDGSSTDV